MVKAIFLFKNKQVFVRVVKLVYGANVQDRYLYKLQHCNKLTWCNLANDNEG
jgi:hypothetical protein